jgi:hypothetical protein
MTPGFYYTAPGTNSTPIALTLNNLYNMPLMIGRACTIDRLGIEVTTAVAASVVRLGILKINADRSLTTLLDAGTVDSSTIGVKELTVDYDVDEPQLLLFCAALQGVTGVSIRGEASTAGFNAIPSFSGSTTLSNILSNSNIYKSVVAGTSPAVVASVTGALAESYPASVANTVIPRIAVRAS